MTNKKQIANLMMVGIIALILLGGLLFTANHMGWFDTQTQSAYAEAVTGITQLEREGIAYPLESEMKLRAGDLITTKKDAQLTLSIGDGTLTLNEETTLQIESSDIHNFRAFVANGEIFAFAPENISLNLMTADWETSISKSVISISAQTGSSALFVYSGKILYNGEEIISGETLLSTDQRDTVSKFKAASLNEFCIVQAQALSDKAELCFTAAQLAKVISDREAAKQALIEEQAKLDTAQPFDDTKVTDTVSENSNDEEITAEEPEETAEEPSDPAETESEVLEEDSEETTEQQSDTEQEQKSEKKKNNKSEQKKEEKAEQKSEQKSESTSEQTLEEKSEPIPEPAEPVVPAAKTCTISIHCDTILNNMDKLEPGKEAYVPGNGKILSTTTVEFSDGETVFDILQRVCSAAGIPLEYSFTPAYNSYYIEGINHLYEFDCGSESGWMYEVNGWFPNYGCSGYTVSEGDSIVWRYTCVGLGADIGGGI